MDPRPRTARLDDFSLALLLTHILVRLLVSGGTAAEDLQISALAWAAAAVWCLGRYLEHGVPLRFSGFELPLAAWGVLCLASILRASYTLPAIKTASAFLSMAALVPLLIHMVGPERRGAFGNVLL